MQIFPLLLSITFILSQRGAFVSKKKRGKNIKFIIKFTLHVWGDFLEPSGPSVAGKSPHAREFWFKNPGISGNFFACGTGGILSFRIRNTSQGMQNPTNDCNPESKFHWQKIRNPVPGTWNQWRGIQNPRLSWIPDMRRRKSTCPWRPAGTWK